MRRTLLGGAALALVAALLADHGGHLGMEATRTALYGIALGSVLGLARDSQGGGGPVARAGGFAAGFAFGWIGYALRAGVLPDIPMGRAIAAFAVVMLVTAVAALSRGRVPMWTGLLGVAAIAGAYETTFGLNPTAFLTESVTAATTVLLAAGIGYVVTESFGETAAVSETEPPRAIVVHTPMALPEQRATETDVRTEVQR